MMECNFVFKHLKTKKDMQDYEVHGGYTNRGISGTFIGNFRILEDNRVIGALNDSGQDIVFNKGKTKLVLGITDGLELNFWKFSPDQRIFSVVYAMRGEGNEYRGNWVPVRIPFDEIIKGTDEAKGIPELEEALQSSTLEKTLEILARIKKSRIKPYLLPSLTRDILNYSQETGHLTLDRVESLTA